MDSELKIWLDYSPKGGEPEPTNEDLDDLFSALRQVIPGDRLQLSQYRFISIPNCSPAELASAQSVARSLRIAVGCKLEERFSRPELRQLQFAPLTVEGDSVDSDADWNPLNRFPSLLCPACRMPDESRLPDPYYVSATQLRRRGQDGVPGLRLQHNREVFSCSCGVFVASDRLKRILDALERPLACAVVAAVPASEAPPALWALRPTQTWGRRQNAVSSLPCPQCGQARRCHVDPDAGPEAFYANRFVVEELPTPQLDLMWPMHLSRLSRVWIWCAPDCWWILLTGSRRGSPG